MIELMLGLELARLLTLGTNTWLEEEYVRIGLTLDLRQDTQG